MHPKSNDIEVDCVMKEDNKRNSIRHESKSMCEVCLDSEIFRGPVIDYSEGIGVIIINNPKVVKGAHAHVKIIDSDLGLNVEIVWTEKLDHGFVRIGFRNLSEELIEKSPEEKQVMEESGDVEETPLRPEPVTSAEEMTAEAEEPVQAYDKADEEMEKEVVPDTVQAAAESLVASEESRFRKKWGYVWAVSLLLVLLVVSMPLVRNNIKKTFLTPPVPTVIKPPIPTVSKKETFPPFRDMAIAKARLEISERATRYPTFREEALKKLEGFENSRNQGF